MDYFPSSKFLTKPKLTKLLAQPSFCMPNNNFELKNSGKFFFGAYHA